MGQSIPAARLSDGLFGNNVDGRLAVESQYGFLAVAGVSIVLGIVLIAVFRFAKRV